MHIQALGCGKTLKYTYTIYSVKYYKKFSKICINFTHAKFIYRVNGVCMWVFS